MDKCEDFIWFNSRCQCSNGGEQLLPGWKGLFHKVVQESDTTHIAGYLPAINKSPTHMDTVQEVLYQCQEKAEGLNLAETDLVLDHANYSKEVEVDIMNERHSDWRSFNLRMGGFHTT